MKSIFIKGFKMPDLWKKNLSETRRGDNNPAWKDKPSYKALHAWIRKHLPNAGICQHCGTTEKRLYVASVGHVYTRDLSTWKWLCCSCHSKMDGRKPTTFHSFLGKHHTEESKSKMREARKKYLEEKKNFKKRGDYFPGLRGVVNRHDMSITNFKKK